jgi:hypothetical protein
MTRVNRIALTGIIAALSLGLAAAALAQTDGEKFAAKQPGLSPKRGYYCTNPGGRHPALGALADQYNWPYEEVLRWFCEGRFGVGEIKHAFEAWTAGRSHDAQRDPGSQSPTRRVGPGLAGTWIEGKQQQPRKK